MNNDLISREALKKALEVTQYNDIDDLTRTERLIDNAPTIEYPEQITIKCDTEEDKQKLLLALRNAKLKVLAEAERPQGEWIHYLGCGIGKAVCSECGKLGETTKCCGNCGAEMRVKDELKEAENENSN